MYLKTQTPAYMAAPELTDGAATLAKYQVWSGNSSATSDDLYALMITPSLERAQFLATLTASIMSSNNVLLREQYV